MQIAIDCAGFHLPKQWLRCSMAETFRRTGEADVQRSSSSKACANCGYPQQRVENCFTDRRLGEYDFVKATPPPALRFLSMFRPDQMPLPRLFLAASWNSQPMGFYAAMHLNSCATHKTTASKFGRLTPDCPTGTGRQRVAHSSVRPVASAPRFDERRYSDDACRPGLAAARSTVLPMNGQEDRRSSRTRLDLSAPPGAAPACRRNFEKARSRRCPTRWPEPSRCAMGREGFRDQVTRTTCRCSRASACRSLSPTRICHQCCRDSR